MVIKVNGKKKEGPNTHTPATKRRGKGKGELTAQKSVTLFPNKARQGAQMRGLKWAHAETA